MNDNLGHNKGDQLIIMASEVLLKCFRQNDIIARIGGDEFVAIIQGCDEATAELLKKRLENCLININKKNNLKLSISVGYSVSQDNLDDLESLIKKADRLMYENKEMKIFKTCQIQKSNYRQ